MLGERLKRMQMIKDLHTIVLKQVQNELRGLYTKCKQFSSTLKTMDNAF